jgi:hypothetical protein
VPAKALVGKRAVAPAVNAAAANAAPGTALTTYPGCVHRYRDTVKTGAAIAATP